MSSRVASGIVVGDIGGTSSRFAAFRLGTNGVPEIVNSVWLKTGEAGSFRELLKQLEATDLAVQPPQAQIVVIAIAGPIERGVYCKPPNVSWDIDLSHAGADFGFQRFALVNDFLAQAFACCTHLGVEAGEVLSGTAIAGGTIGVVGAGTGLGKALLVPESGADDPRPVGSAVGSKGAAGLTRVIGVPSEGGHANFAAESAREFELAEFVRDRVGGTYASWEDVVSGRGIALVHEFLTGQVLAPADVAREFHTSSETLKWCSRFYARVCRDFALEGLTTGGVYVAGGVAAKNPLLLTHPEFGKTFRDSRVHRNMLSQIPVRLMANEESGLWGAAQFAAMQLSRETRYGMTSEPSERQTRG